MNVKEMATEIVKSAIENKVIRFNHFTYDEDKNIEEQKQLNARIFSYCLNIIENN